MVLEKQRKCQFLYSLMNDIGHVTKIQTTEQGLFPGIIKYYLP